MDFSALVGHVDMLTPGNAEVALLRAEAETLLRQVDAREGLRTERVFPIPAGMWNALYRLEPAGVVVKLSSGDNAFEVSFLRDAAALGIPVPPVYGAGRLEHPRLPHASYFLMRYIPDCANGWALAHAEDGLSADALEQLGRDLGQVLAVLHSVRLGYVTRLGVPVERWQTVLTDDFSPNWDDPAPNALFDDQLLPFLRRALEKTAYFDFTDGSLVHGDLVLTNVLVNLSTHRMSAIIDPAGCAGMPMFDLAYAAMPWDHGYPFARAMVQAYRDASDQFEPALFHTSTLVVAYRHNRFHTQEVREALLREVLPQLEF